MPRKLRVPKARRGEAVLKPAALRFLETGEVRLEPDDNPWMVMTLTDLLARAARVAYLEGDDDRALALLRRSAGGHNVFVRPGGA